MNVTIRQIALKAGVSRGTVDRVLNDRPGVKPAIRARVLTIVDELGYVPNMAAKALAYNKKPVLIGIVMPPQEIAFFKEIREGIAAAEKELKSFGIVLDYHYVDNRSPEEAAAAIRKLIVDGASGIMFSVMDDAVVQETINEAADRGIPVVTFNSDVSPSKRVCFVGQDLHKSGVIAAGLMKRMLTARSKLLVLGGNKSFHAHRSRVNGFCEGLAGSGLEVLEVIEAFDRYGDTRDNIASALARYPEVDGIYMATGDVGGCLDAIKRSGRSGAIRIVCNDLLPDIEQGMREGAIDFTIVQNPFQQGYRSLRILYDLLFSGRKPDNEYCYTETSIVIPESL